MSQSLGPPHITKKTRETEGQGPTGMRVGVTSWRNRDGGDQRHAGGISVYLTSKNPAKEPMILQA